MARMAAAVSAMVATAMETLGEAARALEMREAAVWVVAAALTTPSCRRRTRGWLIGGRHSADASSAAIVSALVGGRRPLREALSLAERRFRAIPASALCNGDLDASVGGAQLYARSQPTALGEVDAFVSHSWHDDGAAKLRALRLWAEEFRIDRGREPNIWLDKACIDQATISADLTGLPIYLCGCQQLLVLVGPSYPRRLWCVMEIFSYLQMGGKRRNIDVLKLENGPELRSVL